MQLHIVRRAFADQFTAGLAAFRAEVDDPVGRADHVQVVFDDEQRMPGVLQLAQGAHQLGDVVEVQARGRFVEEKQRALLRQARRRVAVGRGRRFGEETGQLQPLRLAAGQRGHGLAQAHIVQSHVDDGLQTRHHFAVVLEPVRGLGDGEVQHVGNAQLHGPAHHLDVQDFRAIAAAVAIRAAQVDVAEELHLHVLKTAAAAGGATAIAGIEAEGARGVAALTRQRCFRENLAELVKRAHITGRVAARGLADGALVDEDRIAEEISAQQPVVLSRGFRGLAEVACQRGVEHVLDQRALAAAAHARHAHQALQREGHAHVLQVVVARAFQDQLGRGRVHQLAKARAHLLAAAEVGAGQRVGFARGRGRAVEDDLPPTLTRPGAHVDEAVCGQHHRRVVLHHHQRVAGVAQPVHGLHDAVHVARVQADARLVQHEHGVHEAGAQSRGEVDALHLAATERAALAVEREVTQADVAQILQPRAHFVEQQLQRVIQHRAGQAQAVEEAAQPVDAELHQVVQAQAGQRFQLFTRPGRAHRQVALRGRQHGIGAGLVAHAPEQGLQLQARAAAGAAGRVAAVLRQEHADVHLVGLALQVLEEAPHAVPLLVPVAGPVGRAFDGPVALRLRQLAPRRVARNAGLAGVLHQVVLAVLPGRRLHGLDGAIAQRLAVVGDDQAHVDADHAPEAAAGFAGAIGAVEAEHRRLRIGIADVAFRAVQAGAPAPDLRIAFRRLHEDLEPPAAAFQRQLDGVHRAHLLRGRDAETVSHHVQHLARALHALFLHAREAAGGQPLLLLLGGGVGGQFDRKAQHQARVAQGFGACAQIGVDALGRVVPHRQRGLPVEELRSAREEQLQMVVQLGHRADRRARGAHRVGLIDGNGRRHAVDAVHRRAVHAVEKLARIGAEGFDVAPLPLGVQRVEDQAALAAAAGAGDDRQLAGLDVKVEVLEVVLTCTANSNDTGRHGSLRAREGVGF